MNLKLNVWFDHGLLDTVFAFVTAPCVVTISSSSKDTKISLADESSIASEETFVKNAYKEAGMNFIANNKIKVYW